MQNLMLGFPNRIDEATLSGGSYVSTLPLANLKERELELVARTTDTDTTSTRFDSDLTTPRKIRLAALINHNFSLAARYRVQLATVADFSSIVEDSGWLDVWPVVYGPNDIDWEDDNWWGGKYTDEQRAGYTPALIHIFSANRLVRYVRWLLDDTTNAAGYLQYGRPFIGPAWQPTYNMSYGTGLGWVPNTDVQRVPAGAEYFDKRTPWREKPFVLDWLTADEAFAQAFEIQRRAGIDKEVLYIEDPDDTVHALRRRFLARFEELSPIQYPYHNNHSAAFKLKEIL